jgi:molecular chaperone GrpE
MVPASLLREAEAKRDEYLALAKKTQADLENYRKRVQREMATLKRESLSDFLKEFFGALDDLDRAIAEGENKHDYETFHDGVKLVRGNLWKALEGAGVRTIPAEGRPFDPAVHEALTTVPSSERAPGTVLEVFQPGYALDDFVLRPAKVIVAAESPQDDSSEE